MSSFGKQKDLLPSRRRGSFSNNCLQVPHYKPQLNPSRSIAMYELKELNDYYVVNHPILTKSKKKLIEEKLMLDEHVRKQVQDRERDENYFLKYTRNPFSQHGQRAEPQTKEALQGKEGKKVVKIVKNQQEKHAAHLPKPTIIQAINEIKENKFIRGRSAMQRINSYQDASSNFLKSAEAARISFKPIKQIIKAIPIESRQPSIDDLVVMQDTNFYAKSLKNLNIFQVVKGNHGPIVTRSILDRHHFSHESMVDRIGSLKFSFLRDISRLSRTFMLNKDLSSTVSINLINSAEVAVQVSHVKFADLMNISSGRFSPELAYTTANQEPKIEMESDSSSSQADIKEINYSQNARNVLNNCSDPHQEKQEIIEYHHIQNNEEQIKFERFVERIHQNVKAGLNMRSQLVKLTIQDNRQHKRIAETVEENAGYLANMDMRRHKGSIDRQIKANKQCKNRKEALLIHKLLHTISLQNREEEKIQQLLKGNRK